jgi:hypothetical protein
VGIEELMSHCREFHELDIGDEKLSRHFNFKLDWTNVMATSHEDLHVFLFICQGYLMKYLSVRIVSPSYREK